MIGDLPSLALHPSGLLPQLVEFWVKTKLTGILFLSENSWAEDSFSLENNTSLFLTEWRICSRSLLFGVSD